MAVDLVASGKIDPRKLITHRYDFEHAEDAFHTVRKGGDDVLKVMIKGFAV
jgi:D-xylulose reductase